MKQRALKVIKIALFLIAIGLAYAIFIHFTGLGIPCVFRKITGLKCPGCGVTHMCTALLRFDFRAAFDANPVVLCLLPVLFPLLIVQIVKYIRTGSRKTTPVQNCIIIGAIVILLIFGIVRNF